MSKRPKTALRTGVLVAILFLAAGIVFMAMKRDVRNLDSRGSVIVCLGDSLTYGYGAQRGEDYPSRLADFVRAPVVNAGVDSDTSAQGLTRLADDVIARNPFLVVVEFGANDFLKQIPLEETRRNMDAIIRRIQECGAMVAVVDISAGLLFREYRGMAAALAREHNCIFIPGVLRGIITNPSLKSDFVHPNAKGYALIAQRVYLALQPYLLSRAMRVPGQRSLPAVNCTFSQQEKAP